MIFKVTAAFIVLYSIDLAAYFFLIGSAHPTFFQGFVTSPFSPYEDYTSAYASPEQGALYNLGVVAAVIFFTDVYLRFLRPSRLKISPATTGFVLSLVASWTLSGLEWGFKGAPSAGTSIIGSSMLLTLFVFSARDLAKEGRRRLQNRNSAPIPIVPIVFSVASIVIYVASYIINGSAVSHILGDSIFASCLALCLIAVSDAARTNERSKVYLFATVVFMTVLLLAFPTLAPLSWLAA